MPASTSEAATGGIPVAHAVVLGVIQGLSEFLPVSSSGHLVLVPWLLGWNDGDDPAPAELRKTFDVALHVGTFVGALACFRHDVARLAAAGRSSIRHRAVTTPDERLAWLLLLSAAPGALAGALFDDVIEEHLGEPRLIAVLSILCGLGLAAADRASGTRAEGDLKRRDAVILGICQAGALVPGVSRAGATITAGRGLGFERDAAARISFLMSLPIIGGAAAFKGMRLRADGGLPAGVGAAFAWGVAAAAVTGGGAASLVPRVVRTRSFTPFVVYRVAAGASVLGLLASRRRRPGRR